MASKEEKTTMIEEVFPNIYRMEIPLPNNPLRAVNSYVIKGGERYLIIDTGMNRMECRKAMDAGLKTLAVDLNRTDFFITHLHADHLGLVSYLAGKSAKIYFNYPDARIVNEPNHWDQIVAMALVNGFPQEELVTAMQKHPGRKYQQQGALNLTLLREGNQLPIGEYVFHCVETPGHTPGHLCLYEPRTKIFFSGDHILEDITPNITTMGDKDTNPLQQYLDSLDKIERFDISWVFPGHRRVFTHYRERIAELKHHHDLRAEEILSILRKGPQSGYQIASQMTWDISCDTWEDFPAPQKWFAFGEGLSHLLYLHARNEVKKERPNGEILYKRVGE
jgi:glyoxylase-like metal-dependent hydrolase (beta-lactamase superfamily II)